MSPGIQLRERSQRRFWATRGPSSGTGKELRGRRRPSPKKSSLIASTELFPCAWRLSVLSQGRFRPRAASSNWLKQAPKEVLSRGLGLGIAIPQLLSTAAPNLSLLCRLVAPKKRTNRADRSALSADAQRPISTLPNVYSSSRSSPSVIAPSVRSVSHSEASKSVPTPGY